MTADRVSMPVALFEALGRYLGEKPEVQLWRALRESCTPHAANTPDQVAVAEEGFPTPPEHGEPDDGPAEGASADSAREDAET